jgi:hypothetical protein
VLAIGERTVVEKGWIAQGLAMRSPTSVGRLVSAGRKNQNTLEEMAKLVLRIEARQRNEDGHYHKTSTG